MSIPIYQVIEKDIKEKIQKGELSTGDLVPSENELKEIYNVSRMTVRQALNNLVNDGYLYRHKGKGTFVATRKIEKNIHGVRSFSEEMKSMNKKVSSKVLSFSIQKATTEIIEKLFLDEKDEVIRIERIRYGDDIPVLYEQLFIPRKTFKHLTIDNMESSFYKYIEDELNLKISHCIQAIEAKNSDSKVSEFLEVEKHSPILFIVRNTFLNNGMPFEYVKSYYRADQYRFVQHAQRIGI